MMELDLIWIRGCSWMATMDFVKRGCEQKLLRGFTSGSNSASFVPSTPAGEEDALTVSFGPISVAQTVLRYCSPELLEPK
jgi:hypothetical protein